MNPNDIRPGRIVQMPQPPQQQFVFLKFIGKDNIVHIRADQIATIVVYSDYYSVFTLDSEEYVVTELPEELKIFRRDYAK